MKFAQEFWLYLVPLVPVLWFAFKLADKKADLRLQDLLGKDYSSHVEGANNRLKTWKRFFFLTGVFWLLLALAQPQWGANEVAVTQRGSDIVIALDISNSMLAEDVPPNRMGRAVTELSGFLNRLEESRVGLVFFAGAAFVQCPLTLDYGTAEIFLKMAGPDMMSEQGTAIASALETSRKLLGKDRQKEQDNNFQAILLVTDGEDLEGNWEEQAKLCADEGIKVIPVGVGDKGGGLIPAYDTQGRPDGFMKDDEGKVVMSRLDLVSLEKMASMSGGSSFLVGVDGLAGDRLFAELQRLGKRDLEERRVSAFKDRFIWPLLMACFCFFLQIFLHSRNKIRQTGGFARQGVVRSFVLLIIVTGVFIQPQRAFADLRPEGGAEAMAARENFLAGEFEEALSGFEEALIQAPEDPLISLAVGETLFQLERYEEALVEFERALSQTEDPDVQAEALYNLGTANLASGSTEKAVENLMESLNLNPDQADALHNLEVGLRRQQQEQQEQQQEQQNQDENEKEENEENEDQNKQDQNQQDQNEENQENQDDQNQDQQNQDQQEQNSEEEDSQDQENDPENEDSEQDPEEKEQDPQESEEQDSDPGEQKESEGETPDQMSEEQALQVLKALDRDEEELKRSVQKRLRGGRPKSGKKW
ncbi:MAG: VWA domain-containing protein [bacterium]|nr:VWA domain-containing protein [bacterium]